MPGSLNKVMIIGTLGKDPVIRSSQDGNKVVTLSVATSERWTDRQTGEKKERTEWHRVVIFNENIVKVCERYLKKGSPVYLEGQLRSKRWKDDNNIEKQQTEIVLDSFRGSLVLLEKAPQRQDDDGDRASSSNRSARQARGPQPDEGDADDIPF